jgi:glycosyltransferase involved in cell wall biosynthesis
MPDAQHPGSDRTPLNVVIVNDSAAATGGSERVAVAEASGLARRGHRVTLIAGDGEPDPELVDAGVKVRMTGQPTTLDDPRRARAAARGIWNRASAALVRDVLNGVDRRSAIVHVHGYTKVLSASVIRAAVDSGLPAVATLHEYFVACPNGGFFNYQRDEVCHLTPLSARCVATNCDARAYSHKLWRVARTAVQRWPGAMPRGVGDFIAPSRLAGNILLPFLPEGARFHVLPNPITASRTPPADPSSNTAFVFVGRLDHDKGAAMFARAARKASVPAVFVGTGEEADAIRRAYPDAELTGWLDTDGVQAAMRRARAIVSSSLWYETQGLVMLEAAAQGIPAIVSDVSVAREAVPDGECGLWFRAGDEDDLADKLAVLHRDGRVAARLGSAAYERFWSEPRDEAIHLDRLVGIYAGAVA